MLVPAIAQRMSTCLLHSMSVDGRTNVEKSLELSTCMRTCSLHFSCDECAAHSLGGDGVLRGVRESVECQVEGAEEVAEGSVGTGQLTHGLAGALRGRGEARRSNRGDRAGRQYNLETRKRQRANIIREASARQSEAPWRGAEMQCSSIGKVEPYGMRIHINGTQAFSHLEQSEH